MSLSDNIGKSVTYFKKNFEIGEAIIIRVEVNQVGVTQPLTTIYEVIDPETQKTEIINEADVISISDNFMTGKIDMTLKELKKV